MQVTESREFFQVEVIIKATTINQDNINIDFKGLNLYSEDEDKLVEIRNRRFSVVAALLTSCFL